MTPTIPHIGGKNPLAGRVHAVGLTGFVCNYAVLCFLGLGGVLSQLATIAINFSNGILPFFPSRVISAPLSLRHLQNSFPLSVYIGNSIVAPPRY